MDVGCVHYCIKASETASFRLPSLDDRLVPGTSPMQGELYCFVSWCSGKCSQLHRIEFALRDCSQYYCPLFLP